MALSYTTTTGTGAKTTFPFAFSGPGKGYIRPSDIYVFVDGTSVPYTLTAPNTLELDVPPPAGSEVVIRRVMPRVAPFTDFSRGNAFGEDNLNYSFLQQLYLLHEIADGYEVDDDAPGGDPGSGGGTCDCPPPITVVPSLPDPGNAGEGDVVLDEETGAICVLENGAWNCTGAVDTGITSGGPPPSTGDEEEGDVHFDLGNGVIYIYEGGQWVEYDVGGDIQPAAVGTGTTAERPASPPENYTWFNTETGTIQIWDGTQWVDYEWVTSAGEVGINQYATESALPSTATLGSVAYVLDVNKLFLYDNTGWTSDFANADLGPGSVTSDMLAANSVIAGKIAAGAVTADKIEANAITADKIAGGVITADKLAVNSVSASKIQTNAITADKIQSGSITAAKISGRTITASKIAAGAITGYEIDASTITADKINVSTVSSLAANLGTITGGEIRIGSGGLIGGSVPSPGGYSTPPTPSASGRRFYVSSSGYTYVDTLACYGHMFAYTASTAANVSSPSAYFRNSSALSSGVGLKGECSGRSTRGVVGAANHDFYAEAKGTYGPFTGSHEGLVMKMSTYEFKVGDLVCDDKVVARRGVSDTLTTLRGPWGQDDPSVVGVISGIVEYDGGLAVDPEMEQTADYQKTHDLCLFNAVGEGLVNVANEGFDLSQGDLLTSSGLNRGKATLQQDDLVRNSTVGKLREDVIWEDGETERLVACIYMCG